MTDTNVDITTASTLEWLPGICDEKGPLVMSALLPNNILFSVQRGYRSNTPWVGAMSNRGAHVLKEIDPTDTSEENWDRAIKATIEYFSDQIHATMDAMRTELDALTALLPKKHAEAEKEAC